MAVIEGSAAVAVGIDACGREPSHRRATPRGGPAPGTVIDDFVVPPTLVGMDRLTNGWRRGRAQSRLRNRHR